MEATHDAVMTALGGVRDPELDEPLPDLGFVTGVGVQGASVTVRLRLPTYFCAPNFAYLMVADARAAVLALPGVGEAMIDLEDHFASEEINGAVHDDAGFAAAFPGETDGGLDALRTLFRRKAFTARQGRLCEELLGDGHTLEQLARLRLSELPDGPDVRRCVELRHDLGLDASPDAPAFTLPDRGLVDAADLGRFLRVARLVRVSLEGNAGLCRGLLQTRYGLEEVAA